MRALQFTGAVILLLSFFTFAQSDENVKSVYHSFTVGPALPLTNTSVMTNPDTTPGADPMMRELKSGWNVAWTFFKKPFTAFDNALSGLAFGGKISYSRWERDSTYTPVTFLGVEGITRFYIPKIVEPVDFFAQAGAGWFLGEYGFSDPDTVDWDIWTSTPILQEGLSSFGVHFGVGVNADVVEVMPVVTVVATRRSLSAWVALNLGMVF